jgi:hypothetical protein
MATPKVEIFLTTCARADWCLWMLKDIQKESDGVDYNVRVFHDVAPKDKYIDVVAFCKKHPNFHYYRVKRATGKKGYWKVHKYMHELADKLKFDYLIMLQDDMALVENFTKRAISVLGGDVEACSLFPTNYLHKLTQKPTHLPMPKDFTCFHQAPLETLNGTPMRSTNWSDCCYVATKDAVQGIRIEPPTRKYINNSNNGSGVTYSFIKGYNTKSGKRIYQIEHGLVQHIGFFQSSMFGKRKDIPNDKFDRHNNYYIHLTDQDYEYTLNKLKSLCL